MVFYFVVLYGVVLCAAMLYGVVLYDMMWCVVVMFFWCSSPQQAGALQ